MIESIFSALNNPQTVAAILAAVAASAAVLTLVMPMLAGGSLDKRIKAVSVERERIRDRERQRLAQESRGELRPTAKQYMQNTVERFNLRKWFADDNAKATLMQAGYRGQAPATTFLFFRMVAPVVLLAVAAFYLSIVSFDIPLIMKAGICVVTALIGLQAPTLFLKNKISKRQQSIKAAFPDALDLLLICVESGMSIEVAFRKVSNEIGTSSVELAEEFILTTAELSYLPDRRQAYDNLQMRVPLDGVKAVAQALVQSERYGTPLGSALRNMAQENRDMRMNEAEKKAASLPPKLTVPMIVFFLPVLFVVIMGPAVINTMGLK